MHLVGFIIRIYHDVRSSECQTRIKCSPVLMLQHSPSYVGSGNKYQKCTNTNPNKPDIQMNQKLHRTFSITKHMYMCVSNCISALSSTRLSIMESNHSVQNPSSDHNVGQNTDSGSEITTRNRFNQQITCKTIYYYI